ncbi:MAG: transposase, partial [Bacillota bacterium]
MKIWDEEGFSVWSGVKRPLRCFKIEETRLKNGRIEETYTEYLVTSCPKAITPAKTLWRIMHRRWDIENSIFHLLKTYCSFEHCFCHDENAVPAMWLLM